MKAVLWCFVGMVVYLLLSIVATALFVFFETRGNPLVGFLLAPVFSLYGMAFTLVGIPAGYFFHKRRRKALAMLTAVALILLGLAIHQFFQ